MQCARCQPVTVSTVEGDIRKQKAKNSRARGLHVVGCGFESPSPGNWDVLMIHFWRPILYFPAVLVSCSVQVHVTLSGCYQTLSNVLVRCVIASLKASRLKVSLTYQVKIENQQGPWNSVAIGAVLEYSVAVTVLPEWCPDLLDRDRPSQEGKKTPTKNDTLREHSPSQTRNKYWIGGDSCYS